MASGYIMVDCRKMDLTAQQAQTIAGLFVDVRNAYGTGKPVIAVNCLWGDAPMSPISVMVNAYSTGYMCTASTLQVFVDTDDSVTITSMV